MKTNFLNTYVYTLHLRFCLYTSTAESNIVFNIWEYLCYWKDNEKVQGGPSFYYIITGASNLSTLELIIHCISFAFQKIRFKVEVLKTFKISTDCHIKTRRSLKQNSILKIPSTVFRRTYALSVGLKMKPKRFSVLR